MRATWLVSELRTAGLTVVEHTGWLTRGWEPWEPRYGIVHATAAPRTQSDADQVRIVRDGHSTLQGPIANCCVDRTGRWHVLASGRCNTALTGWAGPAAGLGNTNLLGVEACNDNRGEPWPDVQYAAYAQGWAAICRRMGWSPSRCVGHKEHQPGDKSDPTFNMDSFRSRVAAYMEDDVTAQENWAYDLESSAGNKYPAGKRLVNIQEDVDTLLGLPAEVATLRGEVSGLTVLVQQLLTAPPVDITPEQLAQLTAAVTTAAREPGERIEAALVAAGEALATADDEA